MNVLEAKGEVTSTTRDYTKLPSLTCPDCATYQPAEQNGTGYLSFPFEVNATKVSGRWEGSIYCDDCDDFVLLTIILL